MHNRSRGARTDRRNPFRIPYEDECPKFKRSAMLPSKQPRAESFTLALFVRKYTKKPYEYWTCPTSSPLQTDPRFSGIRNEAGIRNRYLPDKLLLGAVRRAREVAVAAPEPTTAK